MPNNNPLLHHRPYRIFADVSDELFCKIQDFSALTGLSYCDIVTAAVIDYFEDYEESA